MLHDKPLFGAAHKRSAQDSAPWERHLAADANRRVGDEADFRRVGRNGFDAPDKPLGNDDYRTLSYARERPLAHPHGTAWPQRAARGENLCNEPRLRVLISVFKNTPQAGVLGLKTRGVVTGKRERGDLAP